MKQGQMKISFGMIFSIILMVFFIAFAFYGIDKFLEIQRVAQVTKFVNEFQSDIDKIWRGFQGSQEVSYLLPTKVDYICFVDFGSQATGANSNLYNELTRGGEKNLVFYPIESSEGFEAKEMEHIDIVGITEAENPFCVETDGKFVVTLKQSFGENLVTIER